MVLIKVEEKVHKEGLRGPELTWKGKEIEIGRQLFSVGLVAEKN